MNFAVNFVENYSVNLIFRQCIRNKAKCIKSSTTWYSGIKTMRASITINSTIGLELSFRQHIHLCRWCWWHRYVSGTKQAIFTFFLLLLIINDVWFGKGDGGTPLVCPDPNKKAEENRFIQNGIVAWGIGCEEAIPAVYTNVAALRQWIDDTIRFIGLDTNTYTSPNNHWLASKAFSMESIEADRNYWKRETYLVLSRNE